MEENVKVSVILPFYNGEGYLDKTMSDLSNQTLKEIEIICVDDGSTDQTVEKLQEYAKQDSRITVLEQKKSNAGVARNLGKSIAKGEYLLFLDSDDYFEQDMLEQMYAECKRYEADLCVCNADQYDVSKNQYIERPQYLRENVLPEKRPFSFEDIGKYILYFTTSVPWNKMVRKEFLEEENIEFQDIARANDQYFSILTLLSAKKIVTVKKKMVHYKTNQKTNLTATFSKTPMCAYEALLTVKNVLDEKKLLENPDIRCAFDNKVVDLALYSLYIQSSKEEYAKLYEWYRKEGFKKLGTTLQKKTYYFNKSVYYKYRLMLHCSCKNYLRIKRMKELLSNIRGRA